jgi:hypothetical protein
VFYKKKKKELHVYEDGTFRELEESEINSCKYTSNMVKLIDGTSASSGLDIADDNIIHSFVLQANLYNPETFKVRPLIVGGFFIDKLSLHQGQDTIGFWRSKRLPTSSR